MAEMDKYLKLMVQLYAMASSRTHAMRLEILCQLAHARKVAKKYYGGFFTNSREKNVANQFTYFST